MHTGYIPLSRKYFKHKLWREDRTFNPAEAWLDLVQRAAFKRTDIFFKNHSIQLDRGELIVSFRVLSKDWKWSVNRVRRFFNFLREEKMIESRVEYRLTVLKLSNYKTYNTVMEKNGYTSDTGRTHYEYIDGYTADTPRIHHEHTADTIYNKVNKEKKVKKDNKEREGAQKNSKEILENESAIAELEKQFPKVKVRLEIEKMKDWLAAKGQRPKDYLAFARNWLRRTEENQKTSDQFSDKQMISRYRAAGAYDGPMITIYGKKRK